MFPSVLVSHTVLVVPDTATVRQTPKNDNGGHGVLLQELLELFIEICLDLVPFDVTVSASVEEMNSDIAYTNVSP